MIECSSFYTKKYTETNVKLNIYDLSCLSAKSDYNFINLPARVVQWQKELKANLTNLKNIISDKYDTSDFILLHILKSYRHYAYVLYLVYFQYTQPGDYSTD